MDEMQLNEILTSFRDAINALIERADAQDGMIKAISESNDEVKHLLFDEVINPAKAELEQHNYNVGLNEFANKYGEQFNGYNEKLRPIEGEDFDIVKQAYDGYNEYEGEKPDEDLYVEELIKVVDGQLDDIRKAIGAPADAKVAVVDNGEGKPEVEVNGEKVEVEQPAEEEKAEEEVVSNGDEEETSDPEELAKLEEELLAYSK